ncbi:alpha/beta fold hydrolase [Rhizobium ruizarguesonis]|uniref:Alpha/beta fold hydrolase n=1 Tax=Rhizobium ruizarguesonis TaxID=2081791 RepID=A0ABY1X013_9HYPH|nr:alpha/beta fold hydrolase [Rhizobium leguminosarum]NEH31492.1 alpha/beta fold hydrolase [Rhizobium ruizarguesonis]TBY63281.1 alpha/beta fold hydrolase [Rhizobium leguminosarum bv. viciae]NEH35647.1 alpha/beta fold hydrolase [Rhizobium ruizarguesonis]NEH67488.1 alpha/beta fold hydrolase [Rhizobium ruizarguesonis]
MERRLTAILAVDMAGYSRLMEQNEEDILTRQKVHRTELFDPQIATRGGRIVKTTGDGMLVEFASAQDAVRCAINIQVAMADREGASPEERRILYRLGINLGDVLFEDGDIFGDGVNVASRLEGLAKPGGICISDIVHQAVADKIKVPFRDMGNQRVKNISRPIRVWQWTPDASLPSPELPKAAQQQQVQFATAPDGVQIAWASIGQGMPVLKAPNWLNHLEYEWRSPIWHPWLVRLAGLCRLVRFDQRGNGLSDWGVEAVSAGAMTGDMSTVAAAAGLSRFALLGISQGCSFSVRYAVENPEQVTCLVLLGGFLRGRLKRTQPDQKHLYKVGTMMIRDGWGSTNPVFRHFFTTTFMPDAQPEMAAYFDELQRIATSPEAAMRIWKMNSTVDVTELAKQVNVPTLVLHCIGDRVAPIEEGRLMATLIPNATFVELPGNNHVLMEDTAAFEQFFDECSRFLTAYNH